MVIVSHELPSLFAVADDGIFLDADGKRPIAHGCPRELHDSAAHPTVHAFLHREMPPTPPLPNHGGSAMKRNALLIGGFVVGALLIIVGASCGSAAATCSASNRRPACLLRGQRERPVRRRAGHLPRRHGRAGDDIGIQMDRRSLKTHIPVR